MQKQTHFKGTDSSGTGARSTPVRVAVMILLTTALLAACRQQPTPQPLPDPMTPDTQKTLAGSDIR